MEREAWGEDEERSGEISCRDEVREEDDIR